MSQKQLTIRDMLKQKEPPSNIDKGKATLKGITKRISIGKNRENNTNKEYESFIKIDIKPKQESFQVNEAIIEEIYFDKKAFNNNDETIIEEEKVAQRKFSNFNINNQDKIEHLSQITQDNKINRMSYI